jgi:outer membrane protein TolC
VVLLRQNSPLLFAAAQEVEAQRGRSSSARGGVLPTLLAGATARREVLNGRVCDLTSLNCTSDATVYAANAVLDQPVLVPSAWAAISSSLDAVDASERSVAALRRVLVVRLVDLLAAAVSAERVESQTRAAVQAASERLELVRNAEKLGALGSLDVLRAEQDLTLSLKTVVQAQTAVSRSREALGGFLGLSVPVGVAPTFDLRHAQQTCHSVHQPEERDDVRAASLAFAANRKEESRIRFLRWPRLDLLGIWHVSSLPIVGSHHQAFTVGGVLSVPIWDGGVLSGQARTAHALSLASERRATATLRAVSLEEVQARRATKSAADALAVAERSRDSAKSVEALTRKSIELGDGTTLELVEAARRLRESEADFVLAEVEAVASQVREQLVLARCEF